VIVIGTAHDANYAELAAITFPSVAEYAEKHGYRVVYEPNISAVEADACKARLFLSLYATGEFSADDVFMWIDTDALVMNSAVRVEDVVGPHLGGDTHFLWAYDMNGPNSGVWFARFSSHAAHYVRVYAQTAIAMGWG
jgi:hypothetical protein